MPSGQRWRSIGVAFAALALLASMAVSPALSIHVHADEGPAVHDCDEATTTIAVANIEARPGEDGGCLLCAFGQRRGQKQLLMPAMARYAVATTTLRPRTRAHRESARSPARASESPRAPPSISG